MKKSVLIALAGLMAATPAFAASTPYDSGVAVYTGYASPNVGGTRFDGFELGGRLTYADPSGLVFKAEGSLQKTNNGAPEFELNDNRFGLAYKAYALNSASVYANIDYLTGSLQAVVPVGPDADESLKGVALGAGATVAAAPRISGYGRVNYVHLRGAGAAFNGVDVLIGSSYDLTKKVGLFAEARLTSLEDGADELDVFGLRLGARYNF